MAKSLRSKSKLKARNVKRYDPKTDYAVTQAARLQATASRLASKNKHGKTLAEEEEEEEGDAEEGDAEGDDAVMGEASASAKETQEADDNDDQPKKVSTSGTRESRRETWRKAKGWKPKKGSKNGGRPSRRK